MKRVAADFKDDVKHLMPRPVAKNGRRIALVGGGPAPVADRTTVLVGGHTWDVYFANNNVTLVRTSNTNSGSVDILAILRWIIANNDTGRGVFTANWTLDQVQFGFNITSDVGTQAFMTNNFSITSN